MGETVYPCMTLCKPPFSLFAFQTLGNEDDQVQINQLLFIAVYSISIFYYSRRFQRGVTIEAIS